MKFNGFSILCDTTALNSFRDYSITSAGQPCSTNARLRLHAFAFLSGGHAFYWILHNSQRTHLVYVDVTHVVCKQTLAYERASQLAEQYILERPTCIFVYGIRCYTFRYIYSTLTGHEYPLHLAIR